MDSPKHLRTDHYAEAAPAAPLSRHVSCLWTRRVPDGAERTHRVVPDGCMDIIWNGASLQVAGPDTGPVFPRLPPGARLVAVRFRPGAAPALLGHPALRRVLRFHRALTLARSRRYDSYAELAAALGYTDQAHLARDVRDLAGATLTELVTATAGVPPRDAAGSSISSGSR